MILHIAKRVIAFPAARALALAVTVWLLLFVYCNYALWRDPHGAYFHSEHIYDQDYSHVRQQDARDFLQSYSQQQQQPYAKAGDRPVLCAAFVTVRREAPDAARYFSDSVGSMLQGLTPQERAALHLSVLFGNVPSPERHPDYNASWVHQLVDHASGYEGLPDTELAELARLQEAEDFQRKGVLDYVYVLEQCYRDTEAPFIAVFEDDIIFAADWMARTLLGLQSLQPQKPFVPEPPAPVGDDDTSGTEAEAAVDSAPWLYLRLFYTETFLGWNDENDYWYARLPLTVALVAFTTGTVLVLIHQILYGCSLFKRDAKLQPGLTKTRWYCYCCQPLARLGLQLDLPTIGVLSLIVAPAFTALVFMAGKYNLPFYALREGVSRTLREKGTLDGSKYDFGSSASGGNDRAQMEAGVFPMDQQGCCTQALVFDRARVPELVAYLRERGRGQTDLMIEDYAQDHSLARFALGEQAVQHVGIMSSRGSGGDAQSVWAFYFEQSDAEVIRARHESTLEKIDWDILQQDYDTTT